MATDLTEARRSFVQAMGGRTRNNVQLPVRSGEWTVRRVRARKPVGVIRRAPRKRPHLVHAVYEVAADDGRRFTRVYFLCGQSSWQVKLVWDDGPEVVKEICSICCSVRDGIRRARVRRGTSNSDVRGNSESRRRRRQFLLDRDGNGLVVRCYRCRTFLNIHTVNVDRIIPGCDGGTYRRDNIRPSCTACGTETGNELKKEMQSA